MEWWRVVAIAAIVACAAACFAFAIAILIKENRK